MNVFLLCCHRPLFLSEPRSWWPGVVGQGGTGSGDGPARVTGQKEPPCIECPQPARSPSCLLCPTGQHGGLRQAPGHPQALRTHHPWPLLPGGEGAGPAGAAGPPLHLHRRLLFLPQAAWGCPLRDQRAQAALLLQVVAHVALSLSPAPSSILSAHLSGTPPE